MSLFPETPSPVVLVVDDVPQSLGLLCHALGTAGYTVLVARDGLSALERLDLVVPDAILLDAIMPGLSGFDTCRRIKENPAFAHIPVIFMTGLAETEDIVQGFGSGGVDYVVKPLRIEEVLARLAAHVRTGRAVRLARAAVDVGDHGIVVADAQRRIAWHSPKAAQWLRDFLPGLDGSLPATWIETGASINYSRPGGDILTILNLGPVGLGESMVLLRLHSPLAAADETPAGSTAATLSRIQNAALTPRETEVLSWVAKGKTNRDIGTILGLSPRTVNKHLEHIFEKLGVETRAAATALASREMR